MDPDVALERIAATQHAMVTRQQARASGLSRHAIAHRLARGRWEAEGPRVLRRPGAPWTKASPLMRAVLDAGPTAVLSVLPAAAWWGLPGFDLLTIDVSRWRGAASTPARFAHRLHEVVGLRPEHVTVLDGIPIVRPERLAFELMAYVHPLRATRAVETLWAKGLLSGRTLRRTHGELAEHRRMGTVLMREFLERHPDDWVPPATNVEARFDSISSGAGLGRWRRQVDLGSTTWHGRVDFLAEDLPLVVEVQSERYHTALVDVEADAIRKAKLEADGFVVVEVSDREVWFDKAAVIAKVAEGRRRARLLLHPHTVFAHGSPVLAGNP